MAAFNPHHLAREIQARTWQAYLGSRSVAMPAEFDWDAEERAFSSSRSATNSTNGPLRSCASWASIPITRSMVLHLCFMKATASCRPACRTSAGRLNKKGNHGNDIEASCTRKKPFHRPGHLVPRP